MGRRELGGAGDAADGARVLVLAGQDVGVLVEGHQVVHHVAGHFVLPRAGVLVDAVHGCSEEV